jgi:hypothetical protein
MTVSRRLIAFPSVSGMGWKKLKHGGHREHGEILVFGPILAESLADPA